MCVCVHNGLKKKKAKKKTLQPEPIYLQTLKTIYPNHHCQEEYTERVTRSHSLHFHYTLTLIKKS